MSHSKKDGNRKPIPEKLRISEPLNTELSKKQIQIAKTWIKLHVNTDWLATYKALKTAQIVALEKGKQLDSIKYFFSFYLYFCYIWSEILKIVTFKLPLFKWEELGK